MNYLPNEIVSEIANFLEYKDLVLFWSISTFYRGLLVTLVTAKFKNEIAKNNVLYGKFIIRNNLYYCVSCGNGCSNNIAHSCMIKKYYGTKKLVCVCGKLHTNNYCDCAFGTTKCNICNKYVENYTLTKHLSTHSICACGKSRIFKKITPWKSMVFECCDTVETNMKIKKAIINKLITKLG